MKDRDIFKPVLQSLTKRNEAIHKNWNWVRTE